MTYLKKHQEQVLIMVSLVLMGLVLGYFVWGMTSLVAYFNAALGFRAAPPQVQSFDLEGARSFHLQEQLPP